MLPAGPQTLSVTLTPTDSTDYSTATATVTLTVNKAAPAISWATPAAITYGSALSATQLDASSTVAGTFVYTPAAGAVLTAGSQTLSVTFTPTDSTDYTGATSIVQLTVNAAPPAITWATPAAIPYGTALSATQLNANTTVAGTFVYTPAIGVVLGVGTQTLSVTFTPTDSTDYTATTTIVTLVVNKATPAIPWATPAAIPYGTALSAAQLDAELDGGGDVRLYTGCGSCADGWSADPVGHFYANRLGRLYDGYGDRHADGEQGSASDQLGDTGGDHLWECTERGATQRQPRRWRGHSSTRRQPELC